MINASSSSSGSEIAGSSGGGGHVQFRMTVKVDIEGHVPAAAVAAAGSCSSDPAGSSSVVSSSSTSSDVRVANPATSTRDLLLKLQPLLPQLCIKHNLQQEASSSVVQAPAASGSSVQKQQEILMPPSPSNLSKNTSTNQNQPAAAGDESGLELSLGLSLFNNKSFGGTAAEKQGENLRTASSWAASSQQAPQNQQQQQQPQNQNQNPQNQNPQAQQNPQPQQMLQRSESMVDWRILEQQRLKREVQCQKRQEARKKRRILIDEQKQQRKAAAAAARSSASLPAASSMNLKSSKKMRSARESHGGAGNAGLESLPQIVEHEDPEADDSRNRMSASARHHSKIGQPIVGRKKRNTHSASMDSANFAAVSAGAVKIEQSEEHDHEQSGTTTVIRPSPIVQQEWVQKFLEMQKMANSSAKSEPSSCCDEDRQEQQQIDSSSHEHQQDSQEQQRDQEEQDYQRHTQHRRTTEEYDESKKLEQAKTVGLTRQGSFQSRSLGSPPPRTGTAARTSQGGVDSSQCSNVCSSMPLAVVSALAGGSSGFQSLMPPPGASKSCMVSPPRDSSKSRLQDHPGPSLFRSTSLGTYRSREDFQNQNQPIQQQQQHSTIRMPSPVRSMSSQHGLMRTLSEGAAMRNLAASLDQESKPPDLANRNNVSSAFKSPKKEPQEHHHHADLKPPLLQNQRPLNRSNSMIQSGEAARSIQTAAPSNAAADLPWVSTTGTGPNGRTVRGVLFAYKKGEVKIVCSCHGQHMTARQFVEHAGGVDVANPEKCIVVSPSKRFTFNIPTTTAS